MKAKNHFDLILVGAGLANALLAYRLKQVRPEISLLLLEQGDVIGGNHTWSFHEGDLSLSAQSWVAPLVSASWTHYEVRFPEFQRQLPTGYYSLQSEVFAKTVMEAMGDSVLLQAEVISLSAKRVSLQNGQSFSAGLVIDGRGFEPNSLGRVAYQKFLGRDVRLKAPHGLTGPCLMDATCEQRDGYRFFYVLPWSEDRCLIEETRYSDSAQLPLPEMRESISAYARSRGWEIAEDLREETGALPLPLSVKPLLVNPPLFTTGVRGGFFHPTTGYSLPDAVRVVEKIASLSTLNEGTLRDAFVSARASQAKQNRFFCFLNRLLFDAAEPEERVVVFQRFYRLPEPLVSRFYSGSLKGSDKLRLLLGKPPVRLARAMQVLWKGEGFCLPN